MPFTQKTDFARAFLYAYILPYENDFVNGNQINITSRFSNPQNAALLLNTASPPPIARHKIQRSKADFKTRKKLNYFSKNP